MSAWTSTEERARAAGLGVPAGTFVVVLNPGSGRDEADTKREAIESVLREAGRDYRFEFIDDSGVVATCRRAARLAQEGRGVLVAVGGDGTISAAAQAAVAHGCPLGVIAQGTFNLFARDHGLPQDPAAGARALLHAEPVPVQVGLVNQRVFLVNASVGLYPKLLEDREDVKQRIGRRRWVAALAGLRSLFEWRWLLDLDVELDGRTARVRTPSVFVCNNGLQLQMVGVEDEVRGRLSQGWLVGIAARPLGALAKLKLVIEAALGRLGSAREIDSFPLRSLTLGTRHARRLKVATDGEVQWMELPLHFSVSPKPLLLMMPAIEDRVPVE